MNSPKHAGEQPSAHINRGWKAQVRRMKDRYRSPAANAIMLSALWGGVAIALCTVLSYACNEDFSKPIPGVYWSLFLGSLAAIAGSTINLRYSFPLPMEVLGLLHHSYLYAQQHDQLAAQLFARDKNKQNPHYTAWLQSLLTANSAAWTDIAHYLTSCEHLYRITPGEDVLINRHRTKLRMMSSSLMQEPPYVPILKVVSIA